MAKPSKNAVSESEKVETFPANDGSDGSEKVETFPETKAVIDGWFVADQRFARCETEDEARELFKACFRFNPASVEPATSYPKPEDSFLFRSPEGSMYGNG